MLDLLFGIRIRCVMELRCRSESQTNNYIRSNNQDQDGALSDIDSEIRYLHIEDT